MTTYLKFSDETACASAFEPFMTEGQYPAYIGASAVDVVGVIYKPTVAVDADGAPETAPIPGYHVNLSGDCPPGLAEFVIAAPAAPVRVFAGVNHG